MSEKRVFVEAVEDVLNQPVLLGDAVEIDERSTTADSYREYQKNKTILKVTISDANNIGDLHIPLENNFVGIIKNEEVEGQTYNSRTRSKYVGQTLPAVVIDVDEENRKVYFSQSKVKEILRSKTKKKLAPGVQTKARVLFVNPKLHRIYIDIEGCGILGYIPLKHWSYGYVYNMSEEIKKGTIVKVEVLEYKPATTTENGKQIGEAYVCSRAKTMPDPWIGIEERYPKNSIIETTCLETKTKYFFGSVPGTDINLMCFYPDNIMRENQGQKRIVIQLNHSYKVRVVDVNEETRKLTCRVVDSID